MKRVGIACVVAVLVAGVLTTQTVKTYYDDTHYSLTYYLARSCGYTPYQAHRLASADVSVDYSPLTEPEQRVLQGLPQQQQLAQEPRVRFHAFIDDRVAASAGPRAVAAQQRELSALVKESRNPGVLLHFLQDIPSHAGYSSTWGHWFSPSAATAQLPLGALTDYLSYRPNRAYETVDAVLGQLRQFLTAEIPAQRVQNCARGQIGPLMSKLLVASPVPAREQVDPGRPLGQLRVPVQVVSGDTPDVAQANLAVAAALAAEGDLRPFPNARIEYVYDARGRIAGLAAGSPNPVYGSLENLVTGPLDSFTLAGSLHVRMTGEATAQVSLWAERTRELDVPYQLTCKTNPGSTVDFDNMPVGDLIVQTVTKAGTITRQPVLLNRVNQDLAITLKPDTEHSTNCSKVAAESARQMCPPNGAPGLPPTLDQLKALESRMRTEIAQAEDCQAQPPPKPTLAQALPPAQPAPPAPPASQAKKKGGSTAKKVVTGAAVAAGGVAGGMLIADAIDKAVSGSSTTSGTSSGGTSGGGTSSTRRCSTLNCIVNVLGSAGSCSCSGTSSAVCPSTSIQSQLNGACFNNGMYCAEGMSCNNNRCERNFSQGGRCRF